MTFIVIILLLLPLTLSNNYSAAAEVYANVLAVQWPPSACKAIGDCDKAAVASVRDFMVHGLWPQVPPTHLCQGTSQKEITRLMRDPDLKFDMNSFWPSFSKSFKNKKFWTMSVKDRGKSYKVDAGSGAEVQPERFSSLTNYLDNAHEPIIWTNSLKAVGSCHDAIPTCRYGGNGVPVYILS